MWKGHSGRGGFLHITYPESKRNQPKLFGWWAYQFLHCPVDSGFGHHLLEFTDDEFLELDLNDSLFAGYELFLTI